MNRTQIVQYVQELAEVVKNGRQIERAINETSANVKIAEKLGDTDRGQQLITQRMNLRNALVAVTELATETSKRSDLDGAELLAQEIEARLDNHAAAHESLVRLKANFELAVELKSFAQEDEEGMTRADAEAAIEQIKQRAETTIKQAEQLIPERRVLVG